MGYELEKENLKGDRQRSYFILIAIVLVVLAGLLTATLTCAFGCPKKRIRPIIGAVAADSYTCSRLGRNILQDGGSAVDAAIVSHLCTGVIHPQSSGIGGGCFFVVYNKTSGTSDAYDGRARAPLAAHKDMFRYGNLSSFIGGAAIGVPGELRAYQMAHSKHGVLPWKDLFDPIIALCTKGFTMDKSLAKALYKTAKENRYNITADPAWRDVFCDDKGNIKKEGDVVVMKKLARTFEEIGKYGADYLYNGNITATLAEEIQERGGIITEKDFKAYSAKHREPLTIALENSTLYVPPPPSSGVIVTLIMNILKGYDKKDGMANDTMKALTYHRMAEAFKFAYAKRTLLADPEFEDLTELVTNSTSDEYADYLRSRITDDSTHAPGYYGPDLDNVTGSGTSHVSVLAPNGDAVALTSTINTRFGSFVMSPSTGIIWNNDMDDFATPGLINHFDVPPAKINFIKPGKRSASAMSPMVVVDHQGAVRLVLGSAGGPRIPTVNAQVAANILWYGVGTKDAVVAPRIHHQLIPNILYYEKGWPKEITGEWERRGHAMENATSLATLAAIHVTREENLIEGASDARKGARAAYLHSDPSYT